MSEISNDNNGALSGSRPTESDPHGQAALLLIESLIHSLIACSVISLEEAIDIVDVAVDVQTDIADEPPAGRRKVRDALELLRALKASLSLDLSE
ncbi:MAG TPA: hypothetical protein VFS04_09810 [Alphaproteobacteria bacterium]|nr:hypothetical protein [Alphaproteobacteria bacterium]